jgi:hypothetical protein
MKAFSDLSMGVAAIALTMATLQLFFSVDVRPLVQGVYGRVSDLVTDVTPAIQKEP